MKWLLPLIAIALIPMALSACRFEPPPALPVRDADVDPRDAEAAGDAEPGLDADADADAELGRDADPSEDAEPPLDAEPVDAAPVEDAGAIDADAIDAGAIDAEPNEASTPGCGNGLLEGDEGCDDGDSAPGDGCNSACDVEVGWSCDAVQPSSCRPICGDGLVRGEETCDDDGFAPGDGCGSDCRTEASSYCEGEPSACSRWFDPAYARRRAVTVDRFGIGEALIDFPVLLVLSPLRIDYAATAPGGIDLRFVAADQTTVLAHEIEVWDPSGISFIWVRVPQIGTAGPPDRIWMYYGGPNVGSPIPSDQVWSADFEAVWHLGEVPVGMPDEILDSTAGLHAGRTAGMNAGSRVSSALGYALEFDGIDDLIDFGVLDPSRWKGISLEARVRWGGSSDHALSMSSGVQPQDHVFSLETPSGTSLRARLTTGGVGGGTSEIESAPGTISAGQWHDLALSWSEADRELRIFVDGAGAGSIPRDGEAVLGALDSTVLGNVNLTDDRHIEATIDEVRISNIARSPEGIEAQHRSMMDRLLVYGPEQTLP